MTGSEQALSPLVKRYLFGISFSSVGIGLTLPFLMVYLHNVRGIPTATVGLIMATMALATLLLAGPTGILVDRYGPALVLILALTVSGLGVVGFALVEQVWQAFLVGTLVAIGNSGIHGPSNALIAALVPVERRQHVYGLQFALLNLGIGVGGLISAALVDENRPGTFQLLYLLSAVAFICRLAVQLSMGRAGGRGRSVARREQTTGDAEPAGKSGYREVLADRAFVRVLVLGLVAITCGYAQFEAGFTAFATQQANISPKALALTFAANTAVIVAAQMLVVKRLRGRSRSRALVVATVAWSASWLLVGSAGLDPGGALAVSLLVAATVVFALGETIWAPILPALVNDLAPAEIRGRYNAAHATTWSVGLIIGPILAGGLIGAGLAPTWIVLISAGCLAAAVMAQRLHRQLTPAQDGRPEPAPADSGAELGLVGPAVGR
ncbi:MAG TPA: MFS transporter [Actinomycetes bacterium]|nr:MFS transporter [Actinomycetes bacterium]